MEGASYMREYNDAISRQMHISLEGICPGRDGFPEGPHGVLWIPGFVATVGDGLWEWEVSPVLLKRGLCPRR